ncbi:MAG TPA: protoporphyrinogen oxidase [Opitutaceae bacterium]|jgi:oxygen-dependent protoporphyrinogen oxidase|nr:protoporphyrinogen oxidase [Opitutaceae bacterium]
MLSAARPATAEVPSSRAPGAPARFAILGAGITGLAAASELRRLGHQVTVFEASDRAGGVIRSLRIGPWLHECGPNSLLAAPGGSVQAVIAAAGLSDRACRAAQEARRRFIVRGGEVLEVPASPGALIRSRLFSARGKLRLAAEPFQGRLADPSVDESVADFTRRRLGEEFLDYAVDPLVGGVYAGLPERLSLRSAFPKLAALERDFGSLIMGAVRTRRAAAGPKGEMLSFPEGLEELPLALARPLGESIRLRAPVSAVRPRGGKWELEFARPDTPPAGAFDGVLCCLPIGPLSRLIVRREEGDEQPFAALSFPDVPPVVSILTGFNRSDIAHPLNGFGLLVPRSEQRRILGTLFSSTMFPQRAPAGQVALTTFVGGARQPELAALDDFSLIRMVEDELRLLLGASGPSTFAHVCRHSRAIPQYEIGYAQRVAEGAAAETRHPGLYFGGSPRDGISLTSCLESGLRLAAAAARATRP